MSLKSCVDQTQLLLKDRPTAATAIITSATATQIARTSTSTNLKKKS